jgi:hypothetical protein
LRENEEKPDQKLKIKPQLDESEQLEKNIKKVEKVND